MKEALLKGLNEEQIAKIKACKNQEEILKLAKEEGVELNDEQLEAVNGGGCTQEVPCPNCGTKGRFYVDSYTNRSICMCPKCGPVFTN